MLVIGRLGLAILAFGLTCALVSGLAFSLFAAGAPDGYRVAVGVACGLLVAGAVWRGTAGALPGLGTAMLKGAALLGGIGFAGGFFGPILLAPEANQGPMLGIFITGPLGFLLGAVAGAIRWQLQPRD